MLVHVYWSRTKGGICVCVCAWTECVCKTTVLPTYRVPISGRGGTGEEPFQLWTQSGYLALFSLKGRGSEERDLLIPHLRTALERPHAGRRFSFLLQSQMHGPGSPRQEWQWFWLSCTEVRSITIYTSENINFIVSLAWVNFSCRDLWKG